MQVHKFKSYRNAHRVFARTLSTTWGVVGVCLLTVLVVEVGLRVTLFVKDNFIDEPQIKRHVFLNQSADYQPASWEAEYDEEYQRQSIGWRSYRYWARDPFVGKYINIDARGVRRTWKEQIPEGDGAATRKRVFVLGGSTVWGTGARDDFTIPSCLAKCLKTRGIAVDVVNLGESGYVNSQGVISLMLRLREGDIPNIVVFYDGINDTFAALQSGIAGVPQNESNRYGEFNLLQDNMRLHQEYLRRLPRELRGFDRLTRAVRNRISAEVSTSRASEWDAQLPREVVEIYEGNIRLVQALAKVYGFDTRFFWQPVSFTKRHLTRFEAQQAEGQRYWVEFLLAVYDQVRKSDFLKRNEDFHDISSIFDDTAEQTYLDWAHMTEEANSLIAERMAQTLTAESTVHPAGAQNADVD